MWTWVDGAEDIAASDGFAVGDEISWTVLTSDFDELLPQLPADFDGVIESAADDDGDDVLDGTIVRIVMATGRRRTVGFDITATPAEHVQVLDMAGFLVEVTPAP
ncbi:MAG: hypothetical protein ABW075_06465 [Aeromicrobium sp.]